MGWPGRAHILLSPKTAPKPIWSRVWAAFMYARGKLRLLAVGQVAGGKGMGFEESGPLSRSTSEKSLGKFPYPHFYSVW